MNTQNDALPVVIPAVNFTFRVADGGQTFSSFSVVLVSSGPT